MFATLPRFTPSAGKDAAASEAPPPPPAASRRSIFDEYWQAQSSPVSSRDDDNSGEGGPSGREQPKQRRSTRLGPSYLGIYSFASSPATSDPAPSPLVGSAGSPSSSTSRPKSILRRPRSLRASSVDSRPGTGIITVEGRPRSAGCIIIPGADAESELGSIAPPPLLLDDSSEDSDDLSRASSLREEPRPTRRQSLVHFDPTVTFREKDFVGARGDGGSNWFTEEELRGFMAETVNLCHASAVNAIRAYSLPAVKKACEAAREAGVKRPVLSTSQPGCRALFADPVLHSTEEDALVHDGSRSFFRMLSGEVRRVLVVDASPTSLKLFERHVLSMFPHVVVVKASSAEDAADGAEGDTDRDGHGYDLIIAEERLHRSEPVDVGPEPNGSELLRRFDEMESGVGTGAPGRRSLKIGVSVSLGEDCESLRRGGADLFWSKPPPKPTNRLRNQLVNALLAKRGKSVFVCGC